MASNQTANYGLSQWEAEDAVLRADFNEDNAKIDAAVKAVDGRVDGLSQTVAGKASQSDLNSEASTRAAAVSALNTALYRRGNCQIETSAYSGNGEQYKMISFSAMPKLILILNRYRAAFISGSTGVMFSYDSSRGIGLFTPSLSWSGSKLTFGLDTPTPHLNLSGESYTVITFYDKS